MISKELLYALQTRSKQMIRVLDDFAGQLKSHSTEERWTVIGETIKLVKELPPSRAKYSHLIKSVNYAWMAAADQWQEDASQLYETIVGMLEQTTWSHPDEAQAAYQLINAFHEHHFRGRKAFISVALRQHSARLLDVIRSLAIYSTKTLFATPIKPHTGVGADAIEMLLEVYVFHTDFKNCDLRGDAATLLLPLVRANPNIGNSLTLSLLQYQSERADIVSQLIEFYLSADVAGIRSRMFAAIKSSMLDNSGSSFIYDDLGKITARLEVSSKQWNDDQFDAFAKDVFGRSKSDEDTRLLLTKSKNAMRLARMIVDDRRSGVHIDALRTICESISAPEPKAAQPSEGVHQFKDLNFKLLVIHELMYIQKTLLPRFDIREFARQYTEREIMIERDGYAVIPEALAYFEGLLIPASLLAQVEHIGFDGGLDIYRHICPHWSGEWEIFDVTSAEDVKLLPNLKCLSGMTPGFVKKYAAELGKKSIEVRELK